MCVLQSGRELLGLGFRDEPVAVGRGDNRHVLGKLPLLGATRVEHLDHLDGGRRRRGLDSLTRTHGHGRWLHAQTAQLDVQTFHDGLLSTGTIPVDHRAPVLARPRFRPELLLGFELRRVRLDEGLDVLRLGEQGLPLATVQRDREATEAVDGQGALLAHLHALDTLGLDSLERLILGAETGELLLRGLDDGGDGAGLDGVHCAFPFVGLASCLARC